jgi:hypothetical protein
MFGTRKKQDHVLAEIDEAVNAICEVVKLAHSPTVFWNEALGLARRAVNV